MEEMKAVQVMSALAQATRLKVLAQLTKALPEGLPSGRIAALTGTPATTMSAHLAILTRAGLVSAEKAGREIVYRAEPEAVREVAQFLVRDFCS